MCGFFGFSSLVPPALVSQKLPPGYLNCEFRGKDASDSASYTSSTANFYLKHFRLIVTGSSAEGSQPIQDAHLLFGYNGEIFNFQNSHVNGMSDTSVLFAAVRDSLPQIRINCFDFLNQFNGFFSIAFFDKDDNSLYLVRDRFGQKPLYYCHSKGFLAFGSSALDLRPYTPNPRAFEELSVRQGGGICFHEDEPLDYIHQVPPGCVLKYKNNILTIFRWYTPSIIEVPDDFGRYCDELDDLLEDAVRLRCHDQDDISITLSGGYDSTLLASYVSKLDLPVHGFTFLTTDDKYAEVSYVRATSNRLGILLNVVAEDPSFACLDNFNLLSRVLEFPAFNPSFVAYAQLYQSISCNGIRTVLEGHGADELFGGYPIMSISNVAHCLKSFSLKNFVLSLRAHRAKFCCSYARSMMSVMRFSLLSDSSSSPSDLIHEFFDLYSLPNVLRVFDRISMLYQVESRSPFLDHRIVEFARNTPSSILFHGGHSKSPLRELLIRKRLLNPSPKIGFTSSFEHLHFLRDSRDHFTYSRNNILTHYHAFANSFTRSLFS